MTHSIASYLPASVSNAARPPAVKVSRHPSDVAQLGREQLIEIYYYLELTRKLEESLMRLQRRGLVIGNVYRSLGQEGTAVGCAYGMADEDFIQPLIRDLGAALVHGVEPVAVLLQYLARATGPTAGRDLNLQFAAPQVGIVGPTAMLGAGIPVIAGCLLASRHRGEGKVGLAFIGDGGSSTGAFFEGVNFAAVQKLPLLIVIEANQYAYSTPTSMQLPRGDLLSRLRGFGTQVLEFDGNDVLACFDATRMARRRAASGEGPVLMLAHTCRRLGHAHHDDQTYRHDSADLATWAQSNDPLNRFEEQLLLGQHLSMPDLEQIRSAVDKAVTIAEQVAIASPHPDPTTQEQGVFADPFKIFPAVSTWFRGGPPARRSRRADHR